MAKVVWKSIYPHYDNNNLFNLESCQIGQNLLLPNIKLRQKLSKLGIDLDTFDLRNGEEQLVVINDLSNDFYDCCGFVDKIKYFIKSRHKRDALRYAKKKKIKAILIMSEPYVVSPLTYNKKFHKYFDKIYTWDDELVDNKKYFKYFIPQPIPDRNYNEPFLNKKLLVLMASNKSSTCEGEFYSKRREFLEFARQQHIDFDLYGYGWDEKEFFFYKGISSNKLETLSKYKFCICYENFGEPGYITEKIFDCFFSNCIPVYLGASNITDYVPSGCFIDRRNFKSNEELCDYLLSINEKEYSDILKKINIFLNSKEFLTRFSDESYSDHFINVIKGELNHE